MTKSNFIRLPAYFTCLLAAVPGLGLADDCCNGLPGARRLKVLGFQGDVPAIIKVTDVATNEILHEWPLPAGNGVSATALNIEGQYKLSIEADPASGGASSTHSPMAIASASKSDSGKSTPETEKDCTDPEDVMVSYGGYMYDVFPSSATETKSTTEPDFWTNEARHREARI